MEEVAGLRLSVFDFKDKLSRMDAKEKKENEGTLDEQYKAVRSEMVKVIQDIDYSTEKMTKTLQSLYASKQKLQKNLNILSETRNHLNI